MQDWRALPEVLRDLDVNLAPLEPLGRFNEAKSAIKWLEAALVGTPTVASPTGPYRAAIDPGRTGLLAGTAEEWTLAIDQLLRDPLARRRMGDAAHREALVTLSPALQGRRYLGILVAAAAAGPADRATAFDGLVVEEAPRPMVLEPYGALGAKAVRRRREAQQRAEQARAVGRRVWASVRDDGLGDTARRAGRVLRRRLSRG
jgi:hypothetical protein